MTLQIDFFGITINDSDNEQFVGVSLCFIFSTRLSFFMISEDFSITLTQDIIKCHLIINQTTRELFFSSLSITFTAQWSSRKQRKQANLIGKRYSTLWKMHFNLKDSSPFLLLFLFFLTNSTPRRNTKGSVQSPHWHFNGNFNNPSYFVVRNTFNFLIQMTAGSFQIHLFCSPFSDACHSNFFSRFNSLCWLLVHGSLSAQNAQHAKWRWTIR